MHPDVVSSGVSSTSSLTRSHLFLDSPNLHALLLSHSSSLVSVRHPRRLKEKIRQQVTFLVHSRCHTLYGPNVGFAAFEQRSPLASGDDVVSSIWTPGEMNKGLLQQNKVMQ